MESAAVDYLGLADRLLPAVLAAGLLEVGYFRKGVAVERKGDASPVTIADREAEAILEAALADAAPGIPVIAEEATAAGRVPAIGDRFFLVDPLDGTKSFINGEPDFTVNVALIENRRPTFGIVYAPASNRLFAALGPSMAVEAVVAPDSKARSFAELPAVRISTRKPDLNRLAAIASLNHGAAEAEAFMQRWRVAERRNIGSSLKFCLVARGEVDVYPRIGEICEWDTAAGDAVLRAAGGSVRLLDGSDLLYGRSDNRFKIKNFIAWSCPELATLLT